MSADHERWADAAGAYVLGAMAAAEREEFESHLSTCAICREEVDELQPAAEALPMASPPMLPAAGAQGPHHGRGRARGRAARARPARPPTGPRGGAPPRRGAVPALGGWRLAPVAAALLIVGVLAGPSLIGGGSADVPRSTARARARRSRSTATSATLVAENLPAPPEGRVYEVWLRAQGRRAAPQPTSVLFMPRGDGSAEAAIPGLASERSAPGAGHRRAAGGSDDADRRAC